MLTTNVDVSDGLANGAVGKLCHTDHDNDDEVSRVWIIFPNPEKVGRKIRSKISRYMLDHKICKTAVPIARSFIPLMPSEIIFQWYRLAQ
jgi:hypothetical protein